MIDFFKKDQPNREGEQVKNILDVREFVTLIIMDGFGIHPDSEGNAVLAAQTPILDTAWTYGRSTLLNAAGLYVGMPKRNQEIQKSDILI